MNEVGRDALRHNERGPAFWRMVLQQRLDFSFFLLHVTSWADSCFLKVKEEGHHSGWLMRCWIFSSRVEAKSLASSTKEGSLHNQFPEAEWRSCAGSIAHAAQHVLKAVSETKTVTHAKTKGLCFCNPTSGQFISQQHTSMQEE